MNGAMRSAMMSSPFTSPQSAPTATAAIAAPGRDPPGAEHHHDDHDQRQHDVRGAVAEVEVERPDSLSALESAEDLLHPRQHDRADDRADQAVHAANDEHGERDEGELEVEARRIERAEKVCVHRPRERDERATEPECDRSFADDSDARCARGRLVLA
jgi:hypothetical protein